MLVNLLPRGSGFGASAVGDGTRPRGQPNCECECSLDTAIYKGDTSNRPETRMVVMRTGRSRRATRPGGTAPAPCSPAVGCSCIVRLRHPRGSFLQSPHRFLEAP